jgi:hypothetical protein
LMGRHGAMNPAGKERGNIPEDKAPSPGMGVASVKSKTRR